MTPLSLGVSCCHREGPPVALKTALELAADHVPAPCQREGPPVALRTALHLAAKKAPAPVGLAFGEE